MKVSDNGWIWFVLMAFVLGGCVQAVSVPDIVTGDPIGDSGKSEKTKSPTPSEDGPSEIPSEDQDDPALVPESISGYWRAVNERERLFVSEDKTTASTLDFDTQEILDTYALADRGGGVYAGDYSGQIYLLYLNDENRLIAIAEGDNRPERVYQYVSAP